MASFALEARLQANPIGGQVVSGAAQITTAPGTVTINQSTTTASINWQDFSIASGELTRFQVPSSTSATLNRVTGGNISAIYGTLQSNGQLYLINPNGIVIGASGKIDTAGFLASTLNFSDTQFNQQGDLTLSGSSTAGVSNQGTIHAATGDVYLIAEQVDNSGTISAPKGTVGLAAGNQVLLQKAGDQHLFVQVDAAAKTKATGVTNSGAIRAAAAELKAAGGNAYALAINNSGNIAATGIATIHGQVYLTADGADISNSGSISATQANGNGGKIVLNAHSSTASSKGTAINSGLISATGTPAGTSGGTVELLGNSVAVTGHGTVDVSGSAGGGTALIGGDAHGANAAVPDADQTYLGPDATIKADALTLGAGGKVVVWSNQNTAVDGLISVRGGAQGGDGGLVETSGAQLSVMTAPDIAAPKGHGGTWLLDPSDITISDSGTPTVTTAMLTTELEAGSVTLDASQGTGGTGTITWTQGATDSLDVVNANGHTLTLDAPLSLTLTGVIVNATGTGGLNVVFNASISGAGSINLQNSTLSLNGGNFTANGNGYQSLVNQNGEANGVNLFNSAIHAQGGSISITGNAGYANPGSGVSAGQGVGIFTGGSPLVALSTTGTGTINIQGTFAQNITSTTPLYGFYLDGAGMTIEADNSISITGTVSQGTSGNSTTAGSASGIFIGDGADVEATANGGTISLTGNASGATSMDVANSGGGSQGITLEGNSSTDTLSVLIGGSLYLNGTGGAFDATLDTAQAHAGDSAGVVIGGGNQITAGDDSTITITGQGGSATSTGQYSGNARGVKIGGDTGGVTISVGSSLNNSGSITITGTGGTTDTTTAAATTTQNIPAVIGIDVKSGSTISALGAASISLNGTGGTVTSGTNEVGDASGVEIQTTNGISPTLISSATGSITVTGFAGTAPELDLGTLLFGAAGESAKIQSTSGAISIFGGGGSNVTGSNSIVGAQIPSYGTALLDDAILQTATGTIDVTGECAFSGVSGIVVAELPVGGFDPTPVAPTIQGTANGSRVVLTGASGAEVDATGTLSAYDFSINSSIINLTGATVTTTDSNYENGTSGGLMLGYSTPSNFGSFFSAGAISISDSVINCAGAQIGNPVDSSFQGTQVSIDGTTINDNRGVNPPGSAQLLISGFAGTAGSPGVGITGGSALTTDSGQIDLQGTGLVAAGSDATGVLISSSTVTCGSAGAPGTGTLEINGSSDSGFTSLTPNSVFANGAYGVHVLGSTITSYSTNGLKISGVAYAANNLDSIGIDLAIGGQTNTSIETFGGDAEIKASVQPEEFASGAAGKANLVTGLETKSTQIEANGAAASVGIDTDTHLTTATDNGVATVNTGNFGAYLLENTSITASGSNLIESTPIHIFGRSGPTVTSSTNNQQSDSFGLWIGAGTTAGPVAVTNSGLGATVIAGEGDSVTGGGVGLYSIGTLIGDSNAESVGITAPGGGSIGIAGLGGEVSPDQGVSGQAVGVWALHSSVTTTTGDIAILAAGGSGVGVAGLELTSATLETNTSTGGANQIPHGGSVPPLILIYATDSTGTRANHTLSFQLGSATSYAVQEDASSSVITGNLVMGDFYDLFAAYGSATTVAAAPTFAQFNSFITGHAASTISSEGITFNPAGIVNLTSLSNQVTNLDSALDGSGGFYLYDSVSLTVDPIGGSNNLNYGQIDTPGLGPVSITVAPNMNLTLTDISPLTGLASSAPVIGSVISTTGAGRTITLTTSGTGQFINTAGASALSVTGGANYLIYAASPSNVTLDGIAAAQMLYNTPAGEATGTTSNTIAFASMSPVTGMDNLSGTAFTDGGSTISPETTIDLLFNGSLLGTTTTSGTGAFSFTISSADLNSGVLLTDPADRGNTFFQATNPVGAITGVDIWGSTLRVSANTVSNFALGQVAGSLTNAGVNYAVNGSSLTTNSGVNMLVLPNSRYTLDGGITANGTLTTGADATLSTSGTGTITLSGTSIALGGPLTSAGTVQFNAAETGSFTSPGPITDSGPLQVGGFILLSGNWTQVVGQNGLGALPAFSASNDFELQGSSTFLRAAGIEDSDRSPYEITDVYGLQGLASPSGALLGANVVLVNNIDASGTATWNGGAGFVPIGNGSAGYTGTFDGQTYTINGLYINRPTAQEVGLFGAIGTFDGDVQGTVQNLGVTNLQVTGGSNVEEEGGPDVGGVVGENFGTITKVYVTGSVNAGIDSNDAGGLVAYNDGTISDSYSTVAVSGSGNTGGFVGDNQGSITDSFSIGPVTAPSGSQDVGGFVGFNTGTIGNAYSAGLVTTGSDSSDVGGFAGYNNSEGGTIYNSFWDTDTAGPQVISGVGSDESPNTTLGVTAATTTQLQSAAYVQAHALTEPGFDFTNTWSTYGDTLTPQLLGLPIAGQVPSSPVTLVLTVDPSKQVNDALFSIVPFPVFEPIPNVNIIGGAGGVAGDEDFGSDALLEKRLARKYGNARAAELLAIILEDRKDGSTVNTGTLAPKWAANTGLSKLLRIEEIAEMSQGLTQSQFNRPLILNLFQQQGSPGVRGELSQAAWGPGAKGDHGH